MLFRSLCLSPCPRHTSAGWQDRFDATATTFKTCRSPFALTPSDPSRGATDFSLLRKRRCPACRPKSSACGKSDDTIQPASSNVFVTSGGNPSDRSRFPAHEPDPHKLRSCSKSDMPGREVVRHEAGTRFRSAFGARRSLGAMVAASARGLTTTHSKQWQ